MPSILSLNFPEENLFLNLFHFEKQRIILHMADAFVCIEYQILQKIDSSFLVGRPSKPGKGGSKPKPKPTAMFDKFTKKKTGL